MAGSPGHEFPGSTAQGDTSCQPQAWATPAPFQRSPLQAHSPDPTPHLIVQEAEAQPRQGPHVTPPPLAPGHSHLQEGRPGTKGREFLLLASESAGCPGQGEAGLTRSPAAAQAAGESLRRATLRLPPSPAPLL